MAKKRIEEKTKPEITGKKLKRKPLFPMKKTVTKHLALLCKSAEERVSERMKRLEPSSLKDPRHLVHELLTHQIELEMQNEELRSALQELEEMRGRFFDLFNSAPIAYFILDRNGAIVEANLIGTELLGVEKRFLIERPFSRFVAPEDRAVFQALYSEVLGKGVQRASEIGLKRKDGRDVFVHIESAVVENACGKLSFCRMAVIDITDRKRAEQELARYGDLLEEMVRERTASLVGAKEELEIEISERRRIEAQLLKSQDQLRSLTARIEALREEDRTHVAREIHDDLGQALTALKMDVSWLAGKCRDNELLSKKTTAVLGSIDDMIRKVKKIMLDLRPGILDHFGVAAALEWLAKDFEERTGISCKIDVGPSRIVIDKERSIAIFRIFQEGLTNVTRHAGATGVEASLAVKEGWIELRVKDNGRGITEEQISDPRSLGLVGMQERVRQWSGDLSISGAPGKGTTVEVRIPLVS